MATSPMPIPQSPPQQAPMPAANTTAAPQQATQQSQGSPQPAAVPVSNAPAAPTAAPAQQNNPAAAKVKASAQSATQTLGKAVTALPKLVENAVKQDKQQKQVRDQLVIKTVFDANAAIYKATDQIQKTKAGLQQIDQHWKEAQELPDSDPSKVRSIAYLAQMHKAAVDHLKQALQTRTQASQQIQGLTAEKANRKVLAQAFGYDEKAANSPERMYVVNLAQKQAMGIQQGAAKELQTIPPIPPSQSSPNGRPDSQPGSTPQSGSAPNSSTNRDSFGAKAKRVSGVIGQVVGDFFLGQNMQDIPGTRQQKEAIQQKALDLQKALGDIEHVQSESDYQEARAGGIEPWQEKQKDLRNKPSTETSDTRARADYAADPNKGSMTFEEWKTKRAAQGRADVSKPGVQFDKNVPYGWTSPEGKQYTASDPNMPEEGKEAIGDALKAYLKGKGNTSKVSGLALYTISRMMQMGYKDNPAILSAMGEFAKAAGMNLQPETIRLLSQIPTDQPLSPTTGAPIGTGMPGAPTGATRNQAQTAQRVLDELPRLQTEVQQATNDLGPVKGRAVMGYLLGTVGSTGDPQKDQQLNQLRTDLTFAGSASAKFHINSVRAMDQFEKLANTGKNTAPAIQGFLNSVKSWATTAAKQERGYGETPATSGGSSSSPKGGNDPLGIFK